MKIILFGATGMIGQGVLLEAQDDPRVTQVLLVTRRATDKPHPKVKELIVSDFLDYSAVESQLVGYDACLFCLGVSAAGLNEVAYRKITVDITLAAAKTLARISPNLTFIYVSGAGTDSSEKGRAMWARVKGEVENTLLKMPFKSVVMFRPGYIQPMKGIRSSTRLYRVVYAIVGPLYPLIRRLGAGVATNTTAVGKAMLRVAENGSTKPILDNRDINQLAGS